MRDSPIDILPQDQRRQRQSKKHGESQLLSARDNCGERCPCRCCTHEKSTAGASTSTRGRNRRYILIVVLISYSLVGIRSSPLLLFLFRLGPSLPSPLLPWERNHLAATDRAVTRRDSPIVLILFEIYLRYFHQVK